MENTFKIIILVVFFFMGGCSNQFRALGVRDHALDFSPPTCIRKLPQYNNNTPSYNHPPRNVITSGPELIDCLHIGTRAPNYGKWDYTYFDLYIFNVKKVKKGGSVLLLLSGEVSNKLPIEIMFVWLIEISKEGGPVITYSKPFGTNILPDQHHLAYTQHLLYTFTEDGDYVFKAKILSAGAPEGSNAHLVVEQGYGQLLGFFL